MTSCRVRRQVFPVRRPVVRQPTRGHGEHTQVQPLEGMVARIAADLTARITMLTADINALEKQITARVRELAPSLLAMTGTAELTAAKITAESAGVGRFRSKDAYARHNGTAPLPAWSANPARHRLSRTGNRQLNCAIHRIAVTPKRCHPPAQVYLKKRIAAGDTSAEALRALERRISDAVYRNLKADAESNAASPLGQAA
jgi:transposase